MIVKRMGRICGGLGVAAALVMLVLLSLASPAAADSMVVQPDGKILLIGDVWPQAAAMARLDPDGAVDPSFGQQGFVIDHRLPPFQALALAKDGRIVGAAFGGVQLARYLPDGAPDPAFGDGGVGGTVEPDQPPFGLFADGPAAIVPRPDGSIVVAENFLLGGGDVEAWIKRYDSNGAFVETVGHVGQFGPASSSHVMDLLEEPDGSLVGAGSVYEPGSPQSGVLARFLPGSGIAYDPDFGGGAGLVRLDLPPKRWMGTSFSALTRDGGKIVAGGDAEGSFLLARFTEGGALDQSFGNGGYVVPPIAGPSADAETANSEAQDVAALGDGRLLIAGGTSEWGNSSTPNTGLGATGARSRCWSWSTRAEASTRALAAAGSCGC